MIGCSSTTKQLHRETQWDPFLSLRVPIPPWPSAWRRTTASTTWWPPQQRPWGCGWTSSSREQRDTHSSWTKGRVLSADTAGTLPSQTLQAPSCFQSTADTMPCLLLFVFFKLTIWFYFVDVFTSTFSVWFYLDWKREALEETHLHTFLYINQNVRDFRKAFLYCQMEIL